VSRRLLVPGGPGWPAGLDDLAELNPSLRVASLWVEGELPELPELPGVAVVGARRATQVGREVARRIGAELGARGVTVVSGFAEGIDVAAHRGCLAARGRTLAVLGCGLAVPYPRAHQGLRTELSLRGWLVTEYTSWDAPLRWHFPHRNRIIAALARAVIVVEAGVSSGALSTARWAADLGREVLAVPASILAEGNTGSNRLLRDGARPYLDVSDLADLLPRLAAGAPAEFSGLSEQAQGRPGAAAGQGAAAVRLLEAIGAEPVPRELVAGALGLGARDLAVLVGEMELTGSIRTLPGGLVQRVHGRGGIR
jgi:DNA processing protein